MLATCFVVEPEARLFRTAGGDADLAVFGDISDTGLIERPLYCFADLSTGAAQKSLPVAEAFAFGVEAPVDEVGHRATISGQAPRPAEGGPFIRCVSTQRFNLINNPAGPVLLGHDTIVFVPDKGHDLACLVYPHVPFDQPAHLPVGVTARQHAFDELVMLGLRIGVLFGLKTDDG